MRVSIRMRGARTLTGLQQEDFSQKHNLGLSSIKNWESGRFIPRLSGMDKFIDALAAEGVRTNRDWLLHGIGTLTFSQGAAPKEELEDEEIIGEAERFKKSCQRKGHSGITTKIVDNSMAPAYQKGDLVGAVMLTEQTLRSLDCTLRFCDKPLLFEAVDQNYFVRWALFDGKIGS